jgi:hypothetical protein
VYNRPDDQQLEAACSIRIVELRCIAYTVIRAVDAGAQRQHQQHVSSPLHFKATSEHAVNQIKLV